MGIFLEFIKGRKIFVFWIFRMESFGWLFGRFDGDLGGLF